MECLTSAILINTISILSVVAIHLALVCAVSCTYTLTDAENLETFLTSGYRTTLRPSDVTYVGITAGLLHISHLVYTGLILNVYSSFLRSVFYHSGEYLVKWYYIALRASIGCKRYLITIFTQDIIYNFQNQNWQFLSCML